MHVQLEPKPLLKSTLHFELKFRLSKIDAQFLNETNLEVAEGVQRDAERQPALLQQLLRLGNRRERAAEHSEI